MGSKFGLSQWFTFLVVYWLPGRTRIGTALPFSVRTLLPSVFTRKQELSPRRLPYIILRYPGSMSSLTKDRTFIYQATHPFMESPAASAGCAVPRGCCNTAQAARIYVSLEQSMHRGTATVFKTLQARDDWFSATIGKTSLFKQS